MTPPRRYLSILAALLLAGGGLAACSSKPASQKAVTHKKELRKRNEKAGKPARLLVATGMKDGRLVTVREVVLPARSLTAGSSTSGGYVVVTPVSGGKPGDEVLGATRVKAGTSMNVRIPLSTTLAPGSYFLVLYGGTVKPTTTTAHRALTEVRITVKK